ncbi:MAG: Fe-S oxidoreductase [Rhodospirillales bacterium]|uniref:(Fe-S)-binding protein n=1 Tax=Hwanghaeella sp. 1Z406 TaxID=3402811 RepID=UPI000C8DBBBC|nr:Fe-S oxidoreductase [Rhodospirillales bacterium]
MVDTQTPEKLADKPPVTVGLFVTCLVDLFRPRVGFAAVELLERAGCQVAVPKAQTCCGQPAYNSGDNGHARAVAATLLDAFDGFDYVVAPSGSCAGMIRDHIPELFADDPVLADRAVALGRKTHELTSFLVDVMGMPTAIASYQGTVTYHDSCSGLRELGVKDQPRRLLKGVDGLTLTELPSAEICCGFGGTFCVKYPDISNKMVSEKTAAIADTGADTLLAGDLGCLLNMAGKMSRESRPIRAFHVAEILAGMGDGPAIGEAGEDLSAFPDGQEG